MSLYDTMNSRRFLNGEYYDSPAPPAEEKGNPYKYTSYWKSPEYVKAVEADAKEAEKRREQEARRARWERNTSILSDIARLGAQVGAHAGGAYMVDRTTPFTDKANEKLERLRKEHASEIEGYAKKLKEAQEKDRQDAMRRAETEYERAMNAERDAYKKRIDERDYNYRKKQDEDNIAIRRDELNEREKIHNKKEGMPSETDKVYQEYYDLIEKHPEFAVKAKDKDGIYTDKVEDYPTLYDMKHSINIAKQKSKKKPVQNEKEEVEEYTPGGSGDSDDKVIDYIPRNK